MTKMSSNNPKIIQSILIAIFLTLVNGQCIIDKGLELAELQAFHNNHASQQFGVIYSAETLTECIIYCGEVDYCRSALYNPVSQDCNILPYTKTTSPESLFVSHNSNRVYFENCEFLPEIDSDYKNGIPIMSKNRRKRQAGCIQETGQVLLTFTDEVVPNVAKIATCMGLCAEKPTCKSGMFFPVESTCMLNSANKMDQPEFYMSEPTAVYFQDCTGKEPNLEEPKIDEMLREDPGATTTKPPPPTSNKPSSTPPKPSEATKMAKTEGDGNCRMVCENDAKPPPPANDSPKEAPPESGPGPDPNPDCKDNDKAASCIRIKELGLCGKRKFTEKVCAMTCGYC